MENLLVFEINDPENLYTFVKEYDVPELPKSSSLDILRQAHLPTSFNPNIWVTRTGDKWRIECGFGKIQPHDTVKLADDLYVGARKYGTLTVDAHIFADNISSPRPVRFQLHMEVDTRTVSLDEIKGMEQERFLNSEKGKRLMAEAQEKSDD